MELSEPYLLTSDRANKQTFTSVARKLLTVGGGEDDWHGEKCAVLFSKFWHLLNLPQLHHFFSVSNTAVTDSFFLAATCSPFP